MDPAELADLLARHGVVRLRDHTHPYRAARRLESAGRVDRVLPGLLVPADADLIVLGAALTAHDPDAVLIEEAAAALTFRRSTRRPSPPLLYASPRKLRAATPWFRAVRRRIDPDDITQVGPVRVTGPALTALDLATRDDAAAIDDAVRTGAATLDDPDRLVADLRTVLELRSPGGGGLSAAASAARRRAG